MSIDDETLMAFADGELPQADADRIAAAIAADPGLAKRIERLRKVRTILRKTYDPVLEEPVPERFRALLDELGSEPVAEPAPAEVVDFAAARERKRSRFGTPAWTAIAASMVLGVLVGRMAMPEALFEGGQGQLVAGASLTRALDQRLAADGEGATRIGLTFRTQDGQYCRTFAHETGVSGLACRDGDHWGVRIAVQENASAGEYRQASAAAPAVLEAVDMLIEGEPLDAAAEAAARDAGWR